MMFKGVNPPHEGGGFIAHFDTLERQVIWRPPSGRPKGRETLSPGLGAFVTS